MIYSTSFLKSLQGLPLIAGFFLKEWLFGEKAGETLSYFLSQR